MTIPRTFLNTALKVLILPVLILALAAPPMPVIAVSAPASAEYFAEFPLGAIGEIEASGIVTLDGRRSRTSESLLGGELIRAGTGSNARLSLPAVGQVTLGSNAIARVTTVLAGEASGPVSHVLVASLLSGEMSVRLEPGASGYLQAGNTGILALDGASIQVGVRNGQAIISRVSGFVESLGIWGVAVPSEILRTTNERARAIAQAAVASITVAPAQPQTLRFSMASLGQITLSNNGAVRVGSLNSRETVPRVIRGTMNGNEIVIRGASSGSDPEKERWALQLPSSVIAAASATTRGAPAIRQAHALRPVGFNSVIYATGLSSQPVQVAVTNVKGEPVVNVPVSFSLSRANTATGSIGRLKADAQSGLQITAMTNGNGLATALFAPENVDGSAMLSVYVEGQSQDENLRWDGQLNVQSFEKTKSSGSFSKRRSLLIFAAAAAATGLAIAMSRRGGTTSLISLPLTPTVPVPTPTPSTPVSPVGTPVICPFIKC